MATIDIPEPLVEEIEELRQAGVIGSAQKFAEEAIREKLLLAKREQMARETEPLQIDLAQIGLSEEELLKEFERFRDAAHTNR